MWIKLKPPSIYQNDSLLNFYCTKFQTLDKRVILYTNTSPQHYTVSCNCLHEYLKSMTAGIMFLLFRHIFTQVWPFFFMVGHLTYWRFSFFHFCSRFSSPLAPVFYQFSRQRCFLIYKQPHSLHYNSFLREFSLQDCLLLVFRRN